MYKFPLQNVTILLRSHSVGAEAPLWLPAPTNNLVHFEITDLLRSVLSFITTCSSWSRLTSSSCRPLLFESHTSLTSWLTIGNACSVLTSTPLPLPIGRRNRWWRRSLARPDASGPLAESFSWSNRVLGIDAVGFLRYSLDEVTKLRTDPVRKSPVKCYVL